MAKSIFLVDDETMLLEVLSLVLEDAGFEVETAATAEECIFILGSKSFDLLVADINLPGMSGVELLAFVKKNIPLMPVMLITSSTELSSAINAIRCGTDDYLCKPFQNSEFLHRIQHCLEIFDFKNRISQRNQLEKRLRNCVEQRDAARFALKELISRSEQIKEGVEQNIAATTQALILPLISELELSLHESASSDTIQFLKLIKQTLAEISDPFARSISAGNYALTAREIQIANLIRIGKTSKEIARLVKISYSTVESHRDAIRRKLGLKNSRLSLAAFLLQMQQ